MSPSLYCNRCWKQLEVDEKCYITKCSHVFCEKDANNWFSMNSNCIACKRNINTDTDLKCIVIGPIKDLTQLHGISNEHILEIAASAIEFNDYQRNVESQYKKYQNSELEKKLFKIEQNAKEKIVEYQNHMNTLTNKLRALQDELNLKQKAFEVVENELKDKSRQLEKFEDFYSRSKSHATNESGNRSVRSPMTAIEYHKSYSPATSVNKLPKMQQFQDQQRFPSNSNCNISNSISSSNYLDHFQLKTVDNNLTPRNFERVNTPMPLTHQYDHARSNISSNTPALNNNPFNSNAFKSGSFSSKVISNTVEMHMTRATPPDNFRPTTPNSSSLIFGKGFNPKANSFNMLRGRKN